MYATSIKVDQKSKLSLFIIQKNRLLCSCQHVRRKESRGLLEGCTRGDPRQFGQQGRVNSAKLIAVLPFDLGMERFNDRSRWIFFLYVASR